VKQKYSIVFILLFINLGAAFAQKKEVVWTGYAVKPESADSESEERFYDITFYNALREFDKNNGYLTVHPGYPGGGFSFPPDYPYIIKGAIEQYRGNIYIFNTVLQVYNNKKKEIYPNLERVDIINTSPSAIIQKHAKSIYDALIYYVNLEKAGNLQQPLADFDKEYMQKIDSMNIEGLNKALQQLSIMEGRFGESEEINTRRRRIEYSAIAVPLTRAEDNIARAFDKRIPNDSSESFCKEAEDFALQVRQVIGQPKDPELRSRLEKVESKIYEYRNTAQFAVYTGGLGLFIEKPLPKLLMGPVIDFQKAYPDILGFNLRYIILSDLPMQWYSQFSYTGGSMKEIPVAYVTEAAIHSLSLSTGMHLQFYINRIIAPYGYFGAGYTHLIEYASDGKDRVILNFPGYIMELGLGTRFHITSRFALEAKAGLNLLVYQYLMTAVNFSLGGSYLFHGKEYLIRR